MIQAPDEATPLPGKVVGHMLDQDAFSQWLGLVVDAVAPGYCRLHFTVRPEMRNGLNSLHGGVTYAAADSAFAFAANSHGRLSVALSTAMDYLEAGKIGETLYVEAREESLKEKIGLYTVRVTNAAGALVALFKGTAYRTGKPVLPEG